MSKYYDVGKKLNKLIDSSLSNANIKGAFVTGGGFAYRSTKYSKDKEVGDFDFMIVFDGFEEISKINNVLQSIGFDCKNLHNVDDQEKYQNGMIDIIRLSGFFGGYKTTINLVPLSLVKTICDMSETRLIKKVAHGRNTGFFYAYGSSGVRQTVCMLCERVVDDEIIFLHLDTTPFIHNKHLYLGILSDAILKGHEKHYDSIEFGKYRKMFIAKIKGYFLENNINATNYLKMFSNHTYFSPYVKSKLRAEYQALAPDMSKIHLDTISEDYVFLCPSDKLNYDNSVFLKAYKPTNNSLKDYVLLKQTDEYNEQYVIDAFAKLCAYIKDMKSNDDVVYIPDILNKLMVYNTNDALLLDRDNYSIETLIYSILAGIVTAYDINKSLRVRLIQMIVDFAKYMNIDMLNMYAKFEDVLIKDDAKTILMCIKKSQGMLDYILNAKSYDDVAMAHNYFSFVFQKNYTIHELELIESLIPSRDSRVLDIMCGYGRMANALTNMGYKNIVATDRNKYDYVDYNFEFVQDDVLRADLGENDLIYSLYNCYDSVEFLNNLVSKIKSSLTPNGKYLIDVFNAEWRASIDKKTQYVVYWDNRYLLDMVRVYDVDTAMETTTYTLYDGKKKLYTYSYTHRFFTLDEIKPIFSDANILTSDMTKTRNNNQKFVIIGGK